MTTPKTLLVTAITLIAVLATSIWLIATERLPEEPSSGSLPPLNDPATPEADISDYAPDETDAAFKPQEDPPTGPASRTLTQTFLTLEGLLEDKFTRKRWGEGDYAQTQDALKRADTALKDPRVNPSKKSLTDEQYALFQQLVNDRTRLVGKAYDQAKALRKEAMVRAARSSRFIAEVAMPHAPHDPRSSEKRLAASKVTLATILEQIEYREGVTKQDVRYTVSATSKPDGVSRQIVTWFTRAQEPEFFAAEAHYHELRSLRESALRAFIDGLP